jgi:SH3-like domain-containing protein
MRHIFIFLMAILPILSQNAQANIFSNEQIRTDTPSKLPVPRFVSMRYNEVNGRAGPNEDYPIRFVYKHAGLPVKVIAETEDWRKIIDPDGTMVWVHKRNLDAKRTLIIHPSTAGATHIMLYKKADLGAKIIAKIAYNSICEIIESENGWRKIRIGNYVGWIIAKDAWGS